MQIISTNIGQPRILEYHGKEVKTGLFKYPVQEPIFLGVQDVEKDNVMDRKHHGGVDKACYLYSADHYGYWQKMYPELDLTWGMFGENLTVEGLQEAEICVGDIFKIGEAEVQATQPRQPCFKLEFRFNDRLIIRKFVDSGFSGVYVRVLKSGRVKAGDLMHRTESDGIVSIKKTFEWIYAEEFDPDVARAIHHPFIAESCKKDLLKRWAKDLSL